MSKRKWTVIFFVGSEKCYDTVEARTPEEAIELWHRIVFGEFPVCGQPAWHDFTTRNGVGKMRVRTDMIQSSEVFPG